MIYLVNILIVLNNINFLFKNNIEYIQKNFIKANKIIKIFNLTLI